MGRSTIAVIWIFLGLFVVAGIYVYSREGHVRDERAEFAAAPPPVRLNPVVPPTHSPAAPERVPQESSRVAFGDDADLLANNGVCNDQRFVGRTGMGGMGMGGSQTIGHDATDCRRAFEQGVVQLRAETDTPIVRNRTPIQETNEADAPLLEEDPQPLRRVQPRYPSLALENGIEGTVELLLTILPNGSVSSVQVVSERPAGKGFADAALYAVRQWTYRPQMRGGVAVARHNVRVTVKFRLEESL